MLLLPIIPSLLGYIHGSSEDNFSEKWENGLLRHSMWPLANFLFLGSKSILMHTRFILVKLCRPTLIQKVWVCGLVVRGADLWGMYVICPPFFVLKYLIRPYFGRFRTKNSLPLLTPCILSPSTHTGSHLNIAPFYGKKLE